MALPDCKIFSDPYETGASAVLYDSGLKKNVLSKKMIPLGPTYGEILQLQGGDLPKIYKKIINILEVDLLGKFVLGNLEALAKAAGKEICLPEIEAITSQIVKLVDCYRPRPDRSPKIALTELTSYFNLFGEFRFEIEKVVELIIAKTILSLLESFLPLLDGNMINKYLYPKENSESDNRAIENTHYNADEIFKNDIKKAILDAIQKYALELSVDEYYRILQKVTLNFNARELNSIFHGVISGDLFDLIKSLIISVVGQDRFETDSQYKFLLEILEEDIEFGLFKADQQNISLCGNPPDKNSDGSQKQMSLEDADKIKKKVSSICDVFRQKITTPTSEEIVPKNSPSSQILIGNSIDAAFDGFGKNQSQYYKNVLNNILINPTGEMCIAAYYLYDDKTNESFEGKIGAKLSDYLKNQLGIDPAATYTDPIGFYFNNKTFKSKYTLPTSPIKLNASYVNGNIKFEHIGEFPISLSFNKKLITVELSGEIFEIQQDFYPENSLWIESHPLQQPSFKNALLEIISGEIGNQISFSGGTPTPGDNSSIEMYQYVLNQELDGIAILNGLSESLTPDLLTKFYFENAIDKNLAEYNKQKFSEIDLLDVTESKNKVKTNLGII